MPARVVRARFAKEATTVEVEIRSPWWPERLFRGEADGDALQQHEALQSVRTALIASGFTEDNQ